MKRAERRADTKTKQKSRQKAIRRLFTDKNLVFDDPVIAGKLKDNHFGCGCGMCKPDKINGKTKLTNEELKARAQELEGYFLTDESV